MQASWHGCCPRIGTLRKKRHSTGGQPPHPRKHVQGERICSIKTYLIVMTWVDKQTANHLSLQSASLPSVQWKYSVSPSWFARWRYLFYTLSPTTSKYAKLGSSALLAAFLFVGNPTWGYAQTVTNKPKVEITTSSSIMDKLNQRIWTKLPAQYEKEIKKFLEEYLIKYSFSIDFTMDFISKEMKSDWWISKENQLLFIWAAIYEWFTKKELYDWDDWNSLRSDEYDRCLESLVQCAENYNISLSKYSRKVTEESIRRTEETRKETVKSLNESLGLLKEFHSSYKENPNEEELKQFKENAKKVVALCIEYNVDYKAVLSPEIRRFYGIE